jgi:tryptophan 2,3-dioxygenase
MSCGSSRCSTSSPPPGTGYWFREHRCGGSTSRALWDAFLSLLDQHGLPVAGGDERRASLLRIARDQTAYADLWDLAEGLLEHDSRASQWRSRHVDMVERVIGTRSGTGGSSGAPYLRGRLALRYYPELWELRSSL